MSCHISPCMPVQLVLLNQSGPRAQGMQRNPGYPSIEGELEKAICKAGGISEANADSFTKVVALGII